MDIGITIARISPVKLLRRLGIILDTKQPASRQRDKVSGSLNCIFQREFQQIHRFGCNNLGLGTATYQTFNDSSILASSTREINWEMQ